MIKTSSFEPLKTAVLNDWNQQVLMAETCSLHQAAADAADG